MNPTLERILVYVSIGMPIALGFAHSFLSIATALHARSKVTASKSDDAVTLRILIAAKWIDTVAKAIAHVASAGFFLRAETMHGWYTYQEGVQGPDLHAMSHGESFLEVLRRRFDSPGFYCLDEPEAALSFSSSLTLLRTLHDIAEGGGQVLCATHSPIVASLPGARVLEVGPWGLRETTWDDLDLVHHWRAYLAAPGRYLRHVLADDDDE